MKKRIVFPLVGILSLAFLHFTATEVISNENLKLVENLAVETAGVNEGLCYFGTGPWLSKRDMTSSTVIRSVKDIIDAKTKGTDCECKDKGEVVKDPTPTVLDNMSFIVQKYGV